MMQIRRSASAVIVAVVVTALPACGGLQQAGTGGGGGGGGNGGGGTTVGGGSGGSISVPFTPLIDFTATVTQVLSGDTIVLSDGTRVQYGDAVAPPDGTRCATDARIQNADLVLNQEVGIAHCDPQGALTTFAADEVATVRAHVVRMDVANLVPGTLTLEGWLLPDPIATCTTKAHDFYVNLAARADDAGSGSHGPNCLEDPIGFGSASIDVTDSVFDPPGDDVSNLNGEYVTIRADGGHVDMSGWKLSDEIGNIYTFPSFVLLSGRTVRVHTGAGTNTLSDLYWNLGLQAWNQSGDRVTLVDAEGRLIDSLQIG